MNLPAGLNQNDTKSVELYADGNKAMKTILLYILKKLWHLLQICLVIASVIIFMILMTQCETIREAEADTHQFIYHTKVLLVVKRSGKIIYCTSPSGVKYFKVKDCFNELTSDTIILRNHRWVYDEAIFIKEIPE